MPAKDHTPIPGYGVSQFLHASLDLSGVLLQTGIETEPRLAESEHLPPRRWQSPQASDRRKREAVEDETSLVLSRRRSRPPWSSPIAKGIVRARRGFRALRGSISGGPK